MVASTCRYAVKTSGRGTTETTLTPAGDRHNTAGRVTDVTLPVQAIVTGRLVDKLDINVSSDENTSNLTFELIDKRRIEPGQPWMPRLG